MLRRQGIHRWTMLAALLVAATGVGSARAQTPAGEPAGASVDPQAIAALERMGAFLRSLKTFEVRAETTTDEVLDSGQKIQFGGTVQYRVRPPDHLWAGVSSDRKQRQFFYDGKTLTMYGQRVQYYATVPAPPTIRQALEMASQRYGLEVPLADIFFWGTSEARLGDITSAFNVGPARVGDVVCDHYAFRQDDADWQIWIETGATPLPRKLVITTTDEEGEPQYAAVLTWNLSPKLDDSAFTFVAPKGAHKIGIETVEAQPEAKP